jgi:uncharacterized protein with FMN-binding domain
MPLRAALIKKEDSMSRQEKIAITAVSLLALSVDASAIFLIPELRMQYSEAALKSTTASTQTSADPNASSSSSSTPGSGSARLKDGTYTGTVISTQRGDFQVNATVSVGKLTAINVTEYPQDPTSQSINAQAIPIYVKEALAAQSAQIQLVSGATETYHGFTGSLQNAINQAQAAQ